MEKFSALRRHHDKKRRHYFMVSVWSDASYFTQLCAVLTAACAAVVEEKTCTEFAETRPAFPGFGRQVDAGDLSIRDRTAPLSHPCLCHRRTFGGQGVTKQTNNSANTAREFEQTQRIRRICGGCECLASCLWAFRGHLGAKRVKGMMSTHGSRPSRRSSSR
jgi:hypothetical protein